MRLGCLEWQWWDTFRGDGGPKAEADGAGSGLIHPPAVLGEFLKLRETVEGTAAARVWAHSTGQAAGRHVGGMAVKEEQIRRGATIVAGAEAVGFVINVQEGAVEKKDGLGGVLDLADLGEGEIGAIAVIGEAPARKGMCRIAIAHGVNAVPTVDDDPRIDGFDTPWLLRETGGAIAGEGRGDTGLKMDGHLVVESGRAVKRGRLVAGMIGKISDARRSDAAGVDQRGGEILGIERDIVAAAPTVIGIAGSGVAVIVRGVDFGSLPDLPEIRQAGDGLRLLTGASQSGKQDRYEKGDDSDHHEQFNQRERSPSDGVAGMAAH